MTQHHDDAADAIQVLRDAVSEETHAAVEQAAVNTVARSQRRWLPFIMAGVVLVSVLIAAATAFAIIDLYGRQTQVATAVGEIRQLAEQAKTAGDDANEQLAQRGQAQVPIPQPGQAQDSDVLVAAATARVLASLPDVRPTAEAIAAEVARYVSQNAGLFAPSAQQILQTVTAYLAENPPPSGAPGTPGADGRDGAKGDKGEKGDPPTRQEIQDAWVALVREQPDVLCPRGGSYTQLRVQLADGGAADMWSCVVQVTPSTTTQPSAVPLLPLGR